jgi:hypothetical protein
MKFKEKMEKEDYFKMLVLPSDGKDSMPVHGLDIYSFLS